MGARLIILIGITMMVSSCQSYRILIDAVAEECFFDRVEAGTGIGVTFEVIDGGFLDIDMLITGPDGEVLYSKERESSGRVALAATKDGMYTYCFSNKMSTITPKEVMFTIEIGEKDKQITQPGDYTTQEIEEIQPEKLEAMIKELKQSIQGIKHEQDYMEVRDRIHGRINESTNHRVVAWVVFEFLMVIFVTASQVVYIKRFFEIRRVV